MKGKICCFYYQSFESDEQKRLHIYMKSLKTKYNVFSASIYQGGERLENFKKDSQDTLVVNGNFEKLKNFVLGHKIDIVYIHGISGHNNPQNFVDFLCRLKNKNIKIVETSPFSLFTKDTEKYLDYKLFVSRGSLLKFLWKFKNPTITRYDYLYNPLDTKELEKHVINEFEQEKVRLSWGINKDNFVVGKIGRADLWKWDDTIINIVPLLLKKIPKLKIVVRAIPKYKIKKLKMMGIFKYFVLLPESVDEQEIANTYQIMDVMLHTSRIGESFGIALTEGMFYGLPVLSIDTDWMQWTAYDRDNSQGEILGKHNAEFINNDIKYLADKIIYLYNNPDYRKSVGIKNKDYVLNMFSVETLNKKLIDVFEDKNLGHIAFNDELAEYKQRVLKVGFFDRLFLSIKATYESFFNK